MRVSLLDGVPFSRMSRGSEREANGRLVSLGKARFVTAEDDIMLHMM